MPLPNFLQRFRSGAQAPVPAPLSSADIELARVRARRRMIGMAVLVGVGVIGFPWLFETQPRPLSPDVQVVSAAASAPVIAPAPSTVARVATAEVAAGSVPDEVVERESRATPAAPQASPVQARAQALVADEPTGASPARPVADAPASHATPASHPAPVHKMDKPVVLPKPAASRPAPVKASAPTKPAAPAKPVVVAKAASTPTKSNPPKPAPSKPQAAKPVAVAKAPSKPEPKTETKADAKGKADADTRYIVQVGAFSDGPSAHSARMKVEALGIKTYTQAVDTPAGKKIRVRIGPYATKAEADKAMATLRKAGVTGNLLTL